MAKAEEALGQAGEDTSKRGLRPEDRRASFIMKETHYKKLRDYAYWQRLSIKEALEQVFEEFFRTRKVRSRPRGAEPQGRSSRRGRSCVPKK